MGGRHYGEYPVDLTPKARIMTMSTDVVVATRDPRGKAMEPLRGSFTRPTTRRIRPTWRTDQERTWWWFQWIWSAWLQFLRPLPWWCEWRRILISRRAPEEDRQLWTSEFQESLQQWRSRARGEVPIGGKAKVECRVQGRQEAHGEGIWSVRISPRNSVSEDAPKDAAVSG